jgi:hypothetical protein
MAMHLEMKIGSIETDRAARADASASEPTHTQCMATLSEACAHMTDAFEKNLVHLNSVIADVEPVSRETEPAPARGRSAEAGPAPARVRSPSRARARSTPASPQTHVYSARCRSTIDRNSESSAARHMDHAEDAHCTQREVLLDG